MQLIRGLHNIKSHFANGCVATIGNYDGVHIGHVQLISVVKKKAAELNLPSVLVVFEPQPEEFFAGAAPARITSLHEKYFLLKEYCLDYLLVLPFNLVFASMSAHEFTSSIICNLLKVKFLVIGDDFVFGCNKGGDFRLLSQFASDFDFQVEKIGPVKIDGLRVSSSLIRLALHNGDLDLAYKFLGREYSVFGKVVSGDRRGRVIGFPTANIFLKKRVLPISGVYIVKVFCLNGNDLYGLANVGFRPTVFGKTQRLEVYLFDFKKNIYGKHVKVEFLERIRGEIKFNSLKDLKIQIEKDVVTAKKYLRDKFK